MLHRRPSCRRGFLRHEVLVLPQLAPTPGQSLPSDIVGSSGGIFLILATRTAGSSIKLDPARTRTFARK